uniref:APO protein 4 n=1 Tax=Rhizophora mucronata TaxID=61149 RepID=A0A2P2J8Y0_RHIMU
MALRKILWQNLVEDWSGYMGNSRFYSSKVDFKKLRPMILKRIANRAEDHPVKPMVPVAIEVLKARVLLIRGISSLIRVFPVLACKFCSEVYIGEKGHLIQTCHGYRRPAKNRVHEWITGGLNDLLAPVETFHLDNMQQKVINHDQGFNFDRIYAIVELCWQAGADPNDEDLSWSTNSGRADVGVSDVESLSDDDLRCIANGTLKAWETLRMGVQKLLSVYPAKVCKYCLEVHIGTTGHKALGGIFKYETHFWQKADVDDLVPPKIVWRRRPQDPAILLNERRNFYGHAPAVVELCAKAGAIVPTKYYPMMKLLGLSAPVNSLKMPVDRIGSEVDVSVDV